MTALALPGTARTGGSRQLAGTGALLRLALRRDRVMLPAWVLIVGGVVATGSGALKTLYGTAAERAELARSMTANSSLRSLYGPVFSDSVGGLVAWRYGVFGAALAGVMSMLVVIRHTREEEETGRQELLSSAMVGRRAPLTAALLAALVANVAMALVVTAGLAGEGAAGALAFGLSIGACGMLFATTAAIAAQLTESARLARGLTTAVVGLAFVLHAAGDAATDDGSSVLTWLSPVGWTENVRAFASTGTVVGGSGERWWVLLLFVAATAVQGVAAYTLAGRRDVGMSFLPTRPGPAAGRMGTAGALAVRLQRGTLLGWCLGFLVSGAVFGGMTEGAADLVGDNEQAREIFQRLGGQSGLTQAFLAGMVGVLGMVAALYGVASVLRLNGEESAGRAEPILANAVGRVRWAAGHLVVAYGGAALVVLLGSAGLALGYGHRAPELLGAGLVQLPAVWTLTGVTLLLYAVAPRAATAGWAVAGVCLAIGWIGPALDLPQPVMDLSPFTHLPKLPGPPVQWFPVVLLTVVAAALAAASLAALRRRDLAT
ncbi:ABC transporter membrane-spanning protein [Streptomyces sulfonofaciens]|uniref:ABC transporter membrane-spanning protein n=1 Tax=Streptomyces sulfonofaciens TaxID=68272 RepID=A0A919FNL6_9ACTN|nr:ABC transporter permease [Streptomyces sulfonofaciens]GHH69428.1 ABC transporter membrane-spanning protein [Streptomyces sulfonofaciens]